MTEVNALVYCILFILAIVHNVTPKIYVINLTNESPDDKNINLQELLHIIKYPDRFKQINSNANGRTKELVTDEAPDYEMDEVDCLTSAEKLKCLANKEKYYLPIKRELDLDQKPKRTTLSLYNYYGGILKYDQPLRISRFSQDYVDVGDLSRFESRCEPECDRSSHYFKSELRSSVSEFPRFNGKIDRRLLQRDLSEGSTSSESSDSDSSKDRRQRKHRKPNRFQVIFNEDSSIESEKVKPKRKPKNSFSSESDDSNEKREPQSDPGSKSDKLREKYSYLQGNKLYDSFRRRLEHFLPKRFHWDSDDIHHLGYYWFDGPRGKDNTA